MGKYFGLPGVTTDAKSHYRNNRAYTDYDTLEEAAMKAWRHAVLDELAQPVCAAPFLDLATSN